MGTSFYGNYGLPSNYTSNPMYMYYMSMLAQQQQQMQAQLQAQREAQAQAQAKAQALAQQQAAIAQQSKVQTPAADPTAADGKDDGKISFGQKMKNLGKGVLNFFKGMVCDKNGKFSLKQTLKTAAVVVAGAALCVATGGAAAPFLVAAGVTMGAVQTGKGVYKACTAKTDAEAEAAWQDIGTGATSIGLSVAGAKGSLKAAGKPVSTTTVSTDAGKLARAWASTKDAFIATKDCLKIAGKGAWNGTTSAIFHPIQSARAVGNYWTNTMQPNLQQAYSYKFGHQNQTKFTQDKINQNISKMEAELQKMHQEYNANPNAKNANELLNKIGELETNIAIEKIKLTAVNNSAENLGRAQCDKRSISQVESQLEAMKANLKNANSGEKAVLESQIKNLENLLNTLKSQNNINLAQQRINSYEAELTALKAKTNPTQADLTRITRLESLINQSKNTLRWANFKTTMKTTLPDIAPGLAACYLSGANPHTDMDTIAQQLGFENAAQMELYAQQNGFANASQMLQAINGQSAATSGVEAGYNAAMQQGGAYATNPYAVQPSVFSQMPQMPPLSFDDLYASPYA